MLGIGRVNGGGERRVVAGGGGGGGEGGGREAAPEEARTMEKTELKGISPFRSDPPQTCVTLPGQGALHFEDEPRAVAATREPAKQEEP